MVITFPELEYLLADDERWPAVRDGLGMSASIDHETMKAAGIISLFARGLGHLQDGRVLVSEHVQEAALRIVAEVDAVSLTRLEDDGLAVGTYLVERPSGRRTLVSLVAPGVLEFADMRTDLAASEELEKLALGILNDADGALGLARAVPEGPRRLTVVKRGDVWTIAKANDEPQPATEEQVGQAVRELLNSSDG